MREGIYSSRSDFNLIDCFISEFSGFVSEKWRYVTFIMKK